MAISARASSGEAPRAISSPARRLRLWRLQHVTIRSPIPASPENVSGRAPDASPSRTISARPRVISAALPLSPMPEPVDGARAERDHVLRRRAELDPDEVGVHVDAEASARWISCWSRVASASSSLAITAAAGRPSEISSAWFGPESTATGRP